MLLSSPTALTRSSSLQLLLILVIGACGGDDTDDRGEIIGCSGVPACYTDALAVLQACVPTNTFTLVPVSPSSGVVDGLTCTAGETTLAFSTFSASPTGTVPVPSGVTISNATGQCAELGSGSGTLTISGGESYSYELSEMRLATETVGIKKYADGAIAIACSSNAQSDYVLTASDVAACPTAVVFPALSRNDDFTRMAADLEAGDGAAESLFVCE
jgi:hypothetical protein